MFSGFSLFSTSTSDKDVKELCSQCRGIPRPSRPASKYPVSVGDKVSVRYRRTKVSGEILCEPDNNDGYYAVRLHNNQIVDVKEYPTPKLIEKCSRIKMGDSIFVNYKGRGTNCQGTVVPPPKGFWNSKDEYRIPVKLSCACHPGKNLTAKEHNVFPA